ncbi:MAG: amidohydrolase family protein [Desulfopila sp.]|jgi:cytosine/adenosine deaminase-related metal-dependent hydrolase|nr:amidohydrolase family protein [Desulfopila sp.]
MSGIVCYTAPWVIPIGTPAIKEGAVVVDHEKILDVGPRSDMVRAWQAAEIHELHGVIFPPLVNSHIHLELSHINDINPLPPGAGMVEWIEELLRRRMQSNDYPAEIHRASQAMIDKQKTSGVVLLADIRNTPSAPFRRPWEGPPEIYHILEVLAPNRKRAIGVERELSEISQYQAVSPHAPYSTSAELIKILKKRAEKNGALFSIHVAESIFEKEFVCSKSGPFRDLLEKRKSWDNTILGEGTFFGSIDYLDKLGVLDERTLCVHCVHIDEKEIEILGKRGAHVCLCPGSNRFLGVGLPPLEKMLAAGLLPCIGTDSSASNTDPDMWSEMRILQENHPSVSAATILQMATYGGAKALGRLDDYGSLERGKRAVFLEIDITGHTGSEESDIFEYLVGEAAPRKIQWIAAPKWR